MAEVDGVEPPTAEVAPPEPPAAPVQDSEPAKDSCGTGGDVSAAEPANCKAASGGLPDAMPGAATDSGGGGTKHGTDVSNVSAACAGATDPESEAQDAADSPAAAVSGEAGETAGAATDPTSAAAASSSPADAASTDASAATATNAATATATSDGAAGAEAAASARDSGADVGQARPPAAVADVEAAASKRLQALPPPQRHGLAAAGLHAVRGRWMRAKNAVATIFRATLLVAADKSDFEKENKSALVQAQVGASDVALEVENMRDLADINYAKQGNAEMYTEDALLARRAVRTHPAVVEAVRAWWRWLPKSSTRVVVLGEADELVLLPRFGLPSDPDYDPAEDWLDDNKGLPYMDFPNFFDAMFELADMWSDTVAGPEYAELLQVPPSPPARASPSPQTVAVAGRHESSLELPGYDAADYSGVESALGAYLRQQPPQPQMSPRGTHYQHLTDGGAHLMRGAGGPHGGGGHGPLHGERQQQQQPAWYGGGGMDGAFGMPGADALFGAMMAKRRRQSPQRAGGGGGGSGAPSPPHQQHPYGSITGSGPVLAGAGGGGSALTALSAAAAAHLPTINDPIAAPGAANGLTVGYAHSPVGPASPTRTTASGQLSPNRRNSHPLGSWSYDAAAAGNGNGNVNGAAVMLPTLSMDPRLAGFYNGAGASGRCELAWSRDLVTAARQQVNVMAQALVAQQAAEQQLKRQQQHQSPVLQPRASGAAVAAAAPAAGVIPAMFGAAHTSGGFGAGFGGAAAASSGSADGIKPPVNGQQKRLAAGGSFQSYVLAGRGTRRSRFSSFVGVWDGVRQAAGQRRPPCASIPVAATLARAGSALSPPAALLLPLL
eukprot:XP_001697318.1 predicted protein [Chlamydomonas reinhardtii]